MPEVLPAVEYPSSDIVRTVNAQGYIQYQSERYFVGEGLTAQLVALKRSDADDVLDVYFCHHRVRQIDLRERAVK